MEDELYARITKGVRKPTKNKVALLSCGASGTGKTTSRTRFIRDSGMRSTFVTLNLDDYWKHAKSQNEARALYRKLFMRTIDDGYSFLFDGTCRNVDDITRLINSLHDHGYTVKLSITYAKLRTTMERLRNRKQQPIRPDLALDIYSEVKRKIEVLMKSNVDEIYLYDNESTTRLIYHRTAKKISCFMPDADFYFDISKYC
jgi:predicted ABC-type ATPase